MAELRRQLGLADGVAVFAGTILGSGIFMAPAGVAEATRDLLMQLTQLFPDAPLRPAGVAGAAPYLLIAVMFWAIGAVISAAGAACYAECGARLPHAGGFFVYFREAFGRPVAFIGGWVALAVTYPSSIAAMGLIFASHLGDLVGVQDPWAQKALGILAIAVAVVLNAIGVRLGSLAQRILTGAKMAALALLVIAAVMVPAAASATAPAPAAAGPSLAGLSAALGIMVWVLWTYSGWSDVTLLAGELKNPGKDLGRTVVIGLVALFVLYAGVQLAVMTILPVAQAAGSQHVVADAVALRMGTLGGRLVDAMVVLSTFGAVNAVIFTSSRLGFAMAKEGVFPAAFSAVGERGSPARSVVAIGVLSLAYVLVAKFQDIVGFFAFTVWIFYAFVAIAVVVLRRRRVGEPATFRAPLGILAPVVILATALFISGGQLLESPKPSAVGLGIIALGALAYAVWRWRVGATKPAQA